MKLALRLALLGLALAPVAALGDNSPQVVMATPGVGDGGSIRSFTARFSQPMVPLGDPRAPSPSASPARSMARGAGSTPRPMSTNLAVRSPAARPVVSSSTPD